MTKISLVIALVVVMASAACSREHHVNISAAYATQDCNKANTQFDLNQCAQANFESADRKMNEMLRAVMEAKDDESAKAQLREAQHAWTERRNRECNEQVGPRDQGGSIWPMDYATCLEQKTAERIRELQKDL
ncbi:MAG TPA: lysozyme inhibitor LprI family protein [Rhizomicrobium sp.]|nr:lysozyme inhibitor LprI family protein [Rhizomicrobium sp.]